MSRAAGKGSWMRQNKQFHMVQSTSWLHSFHIHPISKKKKLSEHTTPKWYFHQRTEPKTVVDFQEMSDARCHLSVWLDAMLCGTLGRLLVELLVDFNKPSLHHSFFWFMDLFIQVEILRSLNASAMQVKRTTNVDRCWVIWPVYVIVWQSYPQDTDLTKEICWYRHMTHATDIKKIRTATLTDKPHAHKCAHATPLTNMYVVDEVIS